MELRDGEQRRFGIAMTASVVKSSPWHFYLISLVISGGLSAPSGRERRTGRPLGGGPAPSESRERESMEPKQPGLVSVLVVDDDYELCQVVKDGLDIEGVYIVATADDGAAGIRAIEQSPPDIVLLDMLMAPSSGFSVLQHLQEAGHERRPKRVIAMSGVSDDETVATIMALGADAVLSKPFTLGELRRTCEQARLALARTGSVRSV